MEAGERGAAPQSVICIHDITSHFLCEKQVFRAHSLVPVYECTVAPFPPCRLETAHLPHTQTRFLCAYADGNLTGTGKGDIFFLGGSLCHWNVIGKKKAGKNAKERFF